MDPEKMPTKLLESDEDHGDNTVLIKILIVSEEAME